MNTSAHCPDCGKPLPPNTPQGLCPECLLKAGLASASRQDSSRTRGFVAPAPADLAPHFPQLEILELIGQGGMGAVYKARQPALERLVALKILAPPAGDSPAFTERFTREARALARLAHPNIVGVHDFGQSGGFHYLIMEYVDGASLRRLLEGGKLAPKEALAIVPPLCDALQFAHDRGIVHRDIKPENILIARDGTVKIADFGLAKIAGADGPDAAGALTGARDVMGTPHYMAPEQIEHPQSVDHRADIYSLGVVFYQMLTGELPLGRFGPPSSRMRGMQIDVRLDEVVLRTLEKEPERRYQHASEVKTEVQSIASGAVPAGPLTITAAISAATREAARAAVQGPAVALMVVNALSLIGTFGVMLLGPLWFGTASRGVPPGGGLAVVLFSATVIGLGVCGFGLWGALQMLRLRSYGAAMAAAIVAVVAPLVFPFPGLLLLPFGIWALVVLGKAEVRAAFGAAPTLPVGAGPIAGTVSPGGERVRFSRGAIVGALWIGLVVGVAAIAGLIALALGMRGRGPLLGVFELVIIAAPITLLVATAPFGATIIGWSAVARIRRSAGRIVGMGLAVFDGLFFPLLALDVAIILIAITILSALRPSEMVGLNILAAAGLVCLAVDWLIATAVWRRVRVAPDGSGKPTGGTNVALAVAVAAVVLLAGVIGPITIRGRSLAPKNEQRTPNVPVEAPAPVAAAVPGTPLRDVEELRILLRQAQEEVVELEPRVKAGIADSAELERAREEVAILQAQVAGDEVAAAKISLARCERELNYVEARHNAGLTTESELRKARLAVDLARHRLARLLPPEAAPSGP